MATVIDSLIVKLGLDTGDFDAKRRKVDSGFNETTKSAMRFLAVLGGTAAIRTFITGIIDANSALDRFSQNLGESTSTISAWSNAAELAGGSASGMQNAMDMLSRAQTELKLTGQSGLIPYFTALRVSLADTHGRARPVSAIMLDMADRFGKMDRTTANNMGRMMGIDQDTMHLLLKGRGEVELMLKRQREYNVVTKQQAEESSRLRRAMIEGRQSFAAFGRELVSAATPALEKLFSVMSAFGDWARQNKEFVATFLKIVAAGLGAIAVAAVPINLVIVGVLGLAAAIALLWQDFQTWKRGGEHLIPWDKWEPGITKALNGIKSIRDALMDAGFRMAAFLTMTYKFYTGDRNGAKAAADAMVAGMKASLGNEAATPAPTAPAAALPKRFGATAQRMSALEKQYGLPEGILDSVWAAESGRGKNMLSPAGAQGHFQFMPATAKQYGLADPYDFNTSADAAARYLRDLIAANGGDVTKAVASYNWGPGNVARKGMGQAPTETRNYVAKVLRGMPGATGFAAGAGAATSADARAPRGGGNSSTETNIGTITINTQATDANGIAKDMSRSLEYLFSSQENVGVN